MSPLPPECKKSVEIYCWNTWICDVRISIGAHDTRETLERSPLWFLFSFVLIPTLDRILLFPPQSCGKSLKRSIQLSLKKSRTWSTTTRRQWREMCCMNGNWDSCPSSLELTWIFHLRTVNVVSSLSREWGCRKTTYVHASYAGNYRLSVRGGHGAVVQDVNVHLGLLCGAKWWLMDYKVWTLALRHLCLDLRTRKSGEIHARFLFRGVLAPVSKPHVEGVQREGNKGTWNEHARRELWVRGGSYSHVTHNRRAPWDHLFSLSALLRVEFSFSSILCDFCLAYIDRRFSFSLEDGVASDTFIFLWGSFAYREIMELFYDFDNIILIIWIIKPKVIES